MRFLSSSPWRKGTSIGLLCCANAFGLNAFGASTPMQRESSLASLFSVEQAQQFATILPADQIVRWQVLAPQNAAAPHEVQQSGALIFVSPSDSGMPSKQWISVLERRNLIYVAADDFGNSKLAARRVLAALMGLALVQSEYHVDPKRIYIAGMSGGGRIASRTITKFPQLFSGALYIVGADFWTQRERALVPTILSKRYVFLTGSKDFNRRDTKRVYDRYRSAGAQEVLLMDLPGYGHEYPNAAQLEQALRFLDGA
jgi:predicted esterase